MNSVRLPAWFASAGLALLCFAISANHQLNASTTFAGDESLPKLLATSQKSFEIPFTIGTNQQNVVEVVLHMSTDRGRTWQEHSRRAPTAKAFPFSCRADQEFWFAIQTIDRNGEKQPTPQALKVELRIAVDTVQPKLEFQVRPDAAGRVVGIWTASDQNIDPCSMVIQYRNLNAVDSEPWFTVPAQMCRTDVKTSYRDELAWWPQIAVKNLMVRAIIKDLAGNQAAVDRPIEIPLVAGSPAAGTVNPLRGQMQVASRPSGSPALTTNYLRSRVPYALSDQVPSAQTQVQAQAKVPAQVQPPIQSATDQQPQFQRNQLRDQSQVPTHQVSQATLEAAPQPPRSRVNRFASNSMDELQQTTSGTQWISRNVDHDQKVTQAATTNMSSDIPVPLAMPTTQPTQNSPQVMQTSSVMTVDPPTGAPTGEVPDPIPPHQSLRDVSAPPKPASMLAQTQDPLAPTTDMPVQTAQQKNASPMNAQWISSTTGMKRTPDPTPSSVLTSGPEMESLRRSAHPSNSNRFQLEYDIDAVGPSGAKSVELWMTPDGGNSWSRMTVDEDLRSPVNAVVEREGIYGFRILVIGNDGLRARQPKNGDPADMWVNVDTTMPSVQIKAVPYGRGQESGNLLVQWTASDANLRMRPIKLSWSTSAQGPWTTIEDGIRNSGQYAWKPAATVPDQVYLKLDVKDVAGNTATHQLNRPIDVSGLLPRGHIRGITPIPELPSSNSDIGT